MKNNISLERNFIDNKDGSYSATISFDITKHGHYFGVPRNYNVGKIQNLIRSKRVQDDIKNGYVLSMYGHGARNAKQGYLAVEHNANTGDTQEPIGKMTSLSIRGSIITYALDLIETPQNKTKSVINLMRKNIGGFSFVWDVDKEVLYGVDAVLSPNFNGNRIVMDSICNDGSCMLDQSIDDEVMSAIGTHRELYDDAKNLLVHQDSVNKAIILKDKFIKVNHKTQTLEEKILELEAKLHNKNVDLEEELKEKHELDRLYHKNKEELNRVKEDSSLKSKDLESQRELLGEHGIEIKDESVILSDDAFGSLASSSNKSVEYELSNVVLDGIKNLKKPANIKNTSIDVHY